MKERGSFGSKLGIVLATAGSAVGLGNVWRFPYMTGENGGAAFILVYIVCILLLGIPGMIGEFVVGRYAQTNAARAYDGLTFYGEALFDWFDFVTGQIFLPVVGFLTCIFIGWYVPHQIVREEFSNWGELKDYVRYFHRYLFLIKYVCPLAIILIFLHQFGIL